MFSLCLSAISSLPEKFFYVEERWRFPDRLEITRTSLSQVKRVRLDDPWIHVLHGVRLGLPLHLKLPFQTRLGYVRKTEREHDLFMMQQTLAWILERRRLPLFRGVVPTPLYIGQSSELWVPRDLLRDETVRVI